MRHLCQPVNWVLLACTLIWTDSFPVTGPQHFTQEIKVEVCEFWESFHVDVESRVMLGEFEISGWKPITSQRIEKARTEVETPPAGDP